MTQALPSSNQLAVFIDFENIAFWAADNDFNFKLTPLMEYLKSRGSVVIHRAYGDFGRLSKYRSELMENSIDMIHDFGIRSGKNRADIRMAIDALETVITRPYINTLVIVSGDSDFGPLVSKLREYGRYTLGIGPRRITHDLLVKSCDEFVYLETILGEMTQEEEQETMDRVSARVLLRKALHAHGQRGDVPVLASRLKQTMLSINSAFNEANFGHPQFKNWLEGNDDLIKLFVKEMQLFVAPHDFPISEEANGKKRAAHVPKNKPAKKSTLATRYKNTYQNLNLLPVDTAARHQILTDIYHELHANPGKRTTDEILDHLTDKYESSGLKHSKATIRQVWQMAFRQRAFDYKSRAASVHVPVWLSAEIEDPEAFIRLAESTFVYAIIHGKQEINKQTLASIICDDEKNASYISQLLESLLTRQKIMLIDGQYLPYEPIQLDFKDDAALQKIWDDIERVKTPKSLKPTEEAIKAIMASARKHRKRNFVRSAEDYLQACHLQWKAIENRRKWAKASDLRYYMASYASTKAGALYQVERKYEAARQYYLLFFYLVQENTPLWERMSRLINPLLSHYWVSAARELNINIASWDARNATPSEIALHAATHSDPALRKKWQGLMRDLMQVNPQLVRSITSEMKAKQTAPSN